MVHIKGKLYPCSRFSPMLGIEEEYLVRSGSVKSWQ